MLACLMIGCASVGAPGNGQDDLAAGNGGTDLRATDLAGGHDLASPADFTAPPPDLTAPPPDLSTPPPDLTAPPPDIACDGNLCTAACVAQCFAMMKFGIGKCMNGACVCVCV